MKRRAFPGYGPDVEARYQRAGQWLLATVFGSIDGRGDYQVNEKAAAWCKANGVALTRAAGETVGTSGGFVVPPDLANAILDLRDSYGAFRRRARIVPMASDTTSVPRRPGGTGAFFFGENQAATETSANVDNINLTAKKIGSLIRLSSEIEEDAIVDMVDFVANEIAFAFAVQEDDCAFNGDGTSTFGRMRGIGTIVLDGNHGKAKVTAASGHNTFLTLDGTDLANLMAGVRASAIPNAAWFCSLTCFANTFCRLTAGGSGGYLETREIDGVLTPCYLGFPVILSAKMPLIATTLSGKMMLAFGDMYAGGALGQRRGVTLARSNDRYLDQDQIAVLGTERFHVNLHDLGDNTNPGSLAALVGN
jgi:HK97 family phage major capsid protein